MRETVADRLRVANAPLVGRDPELQRARELLTNRQSESVLHVHGPGGVGKTVFLRALERLAAEQGLPTTWIDCADLGGTSAGLLESLGARRLGELAEVLPPRSVTFVDGFEMLSPIERWFWTGLLPALPADAVLFLGSRHPPRDLDDRLVAAGVVGALALRNLGPAESAELLRSRGVSAAADVPGLVRETYGHPLALVIAADAWGTRGGMGAGTTLLSHPDPAARLLGRFVDSATTPLQREALHVAGHARRVDRVLLREVLGVDSAVADDLLGWLRERPFAEVHADGLGLHDVVRDALDHDLRWRDPDGYENLHAAIRSVVVKRLRRGEERTRRRAAADLIFLHRGNPATRAMYDFDDLGRCTTRPALDTDHDTIVALVGRVEGPTRTDTVRGWLVAQPDAFHMMQDAAGDLLGVGFFIRLDADPEQRAADPVSAAAWDLLTARRPPGPDELVLSTVAVDARHPERLRSVTDLAAIHSIVNWSDPRLGWALMSSARVEEWGPIWSYIGFEPLGTVVLADDTTVSIWGRDFARSPYDVWLAEMRRRETDETGTMPGPVAAPVAWSRADFGAHVRAALRHLDRPELLADNPLRTSTLVEHHDGDLRAVVVEAVAAVEDDPATQRAARAVDRTFLRRAATQEATAEVLGLPFSTYRRHLAKGIDAVTDVLWQWELHGGRPPRPQVDTE